MTAVNRRGLALRSAEKIFAEYGYDRATMRMIADDADLKLALLTYHFKTKLNLYRSVFEEHQHLNELRVTELRKVDLKAPDALEKIVDAFLIIARVEINDVRKDRYLRMVLREASDPRAYEHDILSDFFDPMAREFIEAFKVVLPERSGVSVRWTYLFSVGALIMSNFNDRASHLADGDSGLEQRTGLLREFIMAGMRSGGLGDRTLGSTSDGE